jgi:hypothetical protein
VYLFRDFVYSFVQEFLSANAWGHLTVENRQIKYPSGADHWSIFFCIAVVRTVVYWTITWVFFLFAKQPKDTPFFFGGWIFFAIGQLKPWLRACIDSFFHLRALLVASIVDRGLVKTVED